MYMYRSMGELRPKHQSYVQEYPRILRRSRVCIVAGIPGYSGGPGYNSPMYVCHEDSSSISCACDAAAQPKRLMLYT